MNYREFNTKEDYDKELFNKIVTHEGFKGIYVDNVGVPEVIEERAQSNIVIMAFLKAA